MTEITRLTARKIFSRDKFFFKHVIVARHSLFNFGFRDIDKRSGTCLYAFEFRMNHSRAKDFTGTGFVHGRARVGSPGIRDLGRGALIVVDNLDSLNSCRLFVVHGAEVKHSTFYIEAWGLPRFYL